MKLKQETKTIDTLKGLTLTQPKDSLRKNLLRIRIRSLRQHHFQCWHKNFFLIRVAKQWQRICNSPQKNSNEESYWNLFQNAGRMQLIAEWKSSLPAGGSTPTQLTRSVERDKMAVSVNLIDYHTGLTRSIEANARTNRYESQNITKNSHIKRKIDET